MDGFGHYGDMGICSKKINFWDIKNTLKMFAEKDKNMYG